MSQKTDDLKPVPCGCGGEAKVETITTHFEQRPRYRIRCEKCNISTIWDYWSEAKAIEAWNRAMGNRMELQTVKERTAKAEQYDWNVWFCSNCNHDIGWKDKYCRGCGARLEWDE